MPQPEDKLAQDARLSAQIEADVGVERIAEVYAQALLGAAGASAKELLDEFDALLAAVFDVYPGFEEILASGLVSTEEKSGIIGRVFAGRASLMMVHFLKVVAAHGRLDCLRIIHRRAHQLYEEMLGRVPVKLTTAAPITDELARKIAENLRQVIQAEPVLTRNVDPQLVGGAVVRIGDTVYDGSIANQLENIRQQMIDRSAHEIQSRRDRFRNTAGN